MTDAKDKKVVGTTGVKLKEKGAAEDKPIYVMKGLFKDTSFIIRHAQEMAKGQ